MSELARTYPEPQQGVAGEDRPGDPVLTSEVASTLVAGIARHLYSATIVGNPAPKVSELYDRMTHPRSGDLVVVYDSINHRDPDTRHRGVGYLVTARAEWWTTRAVWERDKAEDETLTEADRLVDRSVYYVQYGPNPADVCRWTNCTVLAVPRPGDHWA